MLEFVDLHPFFCNLPTRAKAVLQVALKKHHFNTGDFIVKQEENADKLFFIVRYAYIKLTIALLNLDLCFLKTPLFKKLRECNM